MLFEESSFRCSLALLETRSSYFASAFRHCWTDGIRIDGDSRHVFQEFPGDKRAFDLAMAWLSTAEGTAVGDLWPMVEISDVFLVMEASVYLDAPLLLCAAARSWRLPATRSRDELLMLAASLAEVSSRFASGQGQEMVVQEMRDVLQELPKHQLHLAPEFTTSPVAGLVALEARDVARETLVGHIKTVGHWVGSVMGGSERRDSGGYSSEGSPHDFAVKLFELHETYFEANMPELRRVLRHVNPSQPIAAPLCFHLASAAALAAAEGGSEVFAGYRLALDIFERSIGAEADPASAASNDACIGKLFGANAHGGVTQTLGLEVLARPLVPPSAAAVILSRVLASWAGHEKSKEIDAADVIYAGIHSDRQGLRAMLVAALPRIDAESNEAHSAASEWGSCFDLAVPELRAAFAGAAVSTVDRIGLYGADLADQTLILLFKVLFRPTCGLPGIRFPMSLLQHVQHEIGNGAALAAERVLDELKMLQDRHNNWQLVRQLWDLIHWEQQSESLLEEATSLVRDWLADEETIDAAVAVQLLAALPLNRLPRPEELLAPPVPAHVMALMAHRQQAIFQERLMFLEHENASLRQELQRLRSDMSR